MRIGNSWGFGTPVPEGVPQHVAAVVTAVERHCLTDRSAAGAEQCVRWKLTWLEGRAQLTPVGSDSPCFRSVIRVFSELAPESVRESEYDFLTESDDWLS